MWRCVIVLMALPTAACAQVRPATAPTQFSETELSRYVKNGSGAFSPFWVAYIIEPDKDAKDTGSFVELNGKRLGPYGGLSRLIVTSEDGRHIAFAAEKGGKWVIVVDGAEKYTHEGLLWPTFTWGTSLESNSIQMQTQAADLEFSPTGALIAYQAKTAEGKYAVFVNGKAGTGFQGLGGRIVFVGGKVKYYAFPADKKIAEVHGERVFGPYDNSYATAYSPDGAHYALRATKGDAEILLADDKEQIVSGKIADYMIGDKGDLAYAYAASDEKYRVRFGKNDLPGSYDSVRNLTFSPDGSKVAFWASREGKWIVVAGNREFPGFDGYWYNVVNGTQYAILWSRDSQHVAYYVRSKGDLVLDGEKTAAGGTPKGSPTAFVQALLTPDKQCTPDDAVEWGEKLICTGKTEGGQYLHVGEKTEGPYKSITSIMTGRHHYAYVAETSEGKQIVLDGVSTPHVYAAIYRLKLDEADARLDYLAVKEDKVFHVVQPLSVRP